MQLSQAKIVHGYSQISLVVTMQIMPCSCKIHTMSMNSFVISCPWTVNVHAFDPLTIERFSRAGPRGRGREWATLGVHPLSWLLSNNWLEKVPFLSLLHTSSNRLLLSNQDKGCTPSVAHSLPLPLGPALLNLWNDFMRMRIAFMRMKYRIKPFAHTISTPCLNYK